MFLRDIPGDDPAFVYFRRQACPAICQPGAQGFYLKQTKLQEEQELIRSLPQSPDRGGEFKAQDAGDPGHGGKQAPGARK